MDFKRRRKHAPEGVRYTASGKGLGKTGETVNLGGLECDIVTDEEAERADFVGCMSVTTPLIFPDNETGPCVDCGDPLQWRPYAPRKPPRVCLFCAQIRILRAARGAG